VADSIAPTRCINDEVGLVVVSSPCGPQYKIRDVAVLQFQFGLVITPPWIQFALSPVTTLFVTIPMAGLLGLIPLASPIPLFPPNVIKEKAGIVSYALE
jgi:hypothetical protein